MPFNGASHKNLSASPEISTKSPPLLYAVAAQSLPPYTDFHQQRRLLGNEAPSEAICQRAAEASQPATCTRNPAQRIDSAHERPTRCLSSSQRSRRESGRLRLCKPARPGTARFDASSVPATGIERGPSAGEASAQKEYQWLLLAMRIFYLPNGPITLPIMTAASRSQLPFPLVPRYPRSTHSLMASLTRSRFVRSVLAETPPRDRISCTREVS